MLFDVYPVIIFATVLHPRSLQGAISILAVQLEHVDSQKGFYVEVACGLDNLKQKFLVTVDVGRIPVAYDNFSASAEIGRATVPLSVRRRCWVVLMIFTVIQYLYIDSWVSSFEETQASDREGALFSIRLWER